MIEYSRSDDSIDELLKWYAEWTARHRNLPKVKESSVCAYCKYHKSLKGSPFLQMWGKF
jgi:hypothetical protein